MGQGHLTRILIVASRPAVSREVARLLVEAGLHVRVISTIADAIAAVVLDPPTFVVFDSHSAVIEGTRAVNALMRLLEAYAIPAIVFTLHSATRDDGLEEAGRPAPIRPRPYLPSLQAEAELPNESVG